MMGCPEVPLTSLWKTARNASARALCVAHKVAIQAPPARQLGEASRGLKNGRRAVGIPHRRKSVVTGW